MLSLLVTSLIIFTVKSQPQWCMWGSTAELATTINGQYTYLGYDTNTGFEYFGKTLTGTGCPTPTYYLWTNGPQWFISSSTGNEQNYNTMCNAPFLDGCGAGSWSGIYFDAYMIAGTCPQWTCTEVSSDHVYAGCKGPFTQSAGVNAWWNDAGDRALFFAPQYYKWFCSNAIDQQSCDLTSYSYSSVGWVDIDGGTTMLDWYWNDPLEEQSVTMTCTGITVPQPTANPATPYPTQAPVATIPGTVVAAPTLQPTVSVPANEIASICIWGREDRPDNYNTDINGQYYYDGESNGKPSWKMMQHSTCGTVRYVYRSAADDAWWISDQAGKASRSAECQQTDITSCTAGNWWVLKYSWAIDSQMYAVVGGCPNWNCGTLSIPNNPWAAGLANCQAFTEHIGVNAWKAASNYVWYFNPLYFLWVCVNNEEYAYDSCSGTSFEIQAEGWQDLSTGNSVDLTLTYPDSQPSITVECEGTGSIPTQTPVTPQPTTTVEPTASPTTDKPTDAPHKPGSPTKAPTPPTPKPTDAPSKKVTPAPIKAPTEAPVKPGSPTKPPTPPTPKPTEHPIIPGTPTKPPTQRPTPKPDSGTGTTPTTPGTGTTPTTPGTVIVDVDSEWYCVDISNLNQIQLNGIYNKQGTFNDRSVYNLAQHWLYYYHDGSHDYWYISVSKGSTDWANIYAYCQRQDLTHCSGVWHVYDDGNGDDDYPEDTDSEVINCGTTQSPGDDDDDNGDDDNDGNGDDDDDDDDQKGLGGGSGLLGAVLLWWVWVAVLIIICCCCCICIICCIMKRKNRKYDKAADDEYGDTVQMNRKNKASPYIQQQVYRDANA